ncbi:MAG: branched-chain amino acid aminotransferase [Acetobacteraceae bacterium]|nr:branched-chain amino acid aminotransferase [Acetobacteraceae bacterium]
MDQKWLFASSKHPNPTPAADIAAAIENPGFGTVFSDHMITVQWTEAQGWHDARLEDRKPFQIDPAAAVLHYAQEIFEGLKAYQLADGTVALFRPEQNARRFIKSAERLAMAPVPESLFLQAVETLVRSEKAWIPGGEGSLYIRPFQFASETFLGVRPSHKYTFCVIASPVGPYFKGGQKAITVWSTDTYTRASAGGTGSAKCGGNYANSLLAQAEASQNGCDQVVFLDAAEHRWIEELGGMNIFFVLDDGALVTPPLAGTILPGITRSSVIELVREEGGTVHERPYSFPEWQADCQSGRVKEAFACGTAAVISAIGKVRYPGGEFVIGDGDSGATTKRIHSLLTGIQRGKIADTHGWVHRVA